MADALDQQTFEIIARAAADAGVPLHLALGVAHVETGGTFRPDLTSDRGAQGLFQLMPGTARDLGVTNPMDPAQSARGGLEFLAHKIAKYRGDVEKALAAYNWGPGNVKLKPTPAQWPAQVRGYVSKVLRNAQKYKGAIAALPFVLTPPARPPAGVPA
jgi:soluble lytic murein transglycosylase-like protein